MRERRDGFAGENALSAIARGMWRLDGILRCLCLDSVVADSGVRVEGGWGAEGGVFGVVCTFINCLFCLHYLLRRSLLDFCFIIFGVLPYHPNGNYSFLKKRVPQ